MGTTRALSIQSSSKLAPPEVAEMYLQRWQSQASRAEPESPSRARQSQRLQSWQRHVSRGCKDVPQRWQSQASRASIASRDGRAKTSEVGLQRPKSADYRM
ncbi:hypothetical protein F0562_005847 [Nyssa sinensis]|uniref:DUF4005 domain-containing protein n=1 Tax=Nyssa sinensis TaxID=561372 RepID=A0A5J5ALL8_9ASTE|nr:hypothetical protein F0562_005847 [Nyssa sinensis]